MGKPTIATDAAEESTPRKPRAVKKTQVVVITDGTVAKVSAPESVQVLNLNLADLQADDETVFDAAIDIATQITDRRLRNETLMRIARSAPTLGLEEAAPTGELVAA